MAENEDQQSMDEDSSATIQTQKIYLKDLSFEAPNSPEIFLKDWRPALTVDIGHLIKKVADDVYEVVVSVTATMKNGDVVAYLAEIQQAGIFTMKGIAPERLDHILNVFCPRTLYPYASSTATEVVARGGFPQLILAPISFQSIYMNKLAEAKKAAEADS